MSSSNFLTSIVIASSVISSLCADDMEQQQETSSSPSMGCEVYGEFLWLQPQASNLYYAVEANGLDQSIAVPAVSPNWNLKEINPDYHVGFNVGTKVLFNFAKLNLNLNWERLYGTDSARYETSLASGFMVGPITDIGPNSEPYKIATGKAKTEFDQANLTFGRKFCADDALFANIYAGVSFARIKESINTSYSNTAGTISRAVDSPSTFTGGGPQFGMDYKYRIIDGLFFNGSTVASFIMGTLKNSQSYTSYTPDLVTMGCPNPNVQKTSIPNRTQLVPGLEQKLGMSYEVGNDWCKFSVGLGYQCQVFFNAIQSFDMTAPQVEPSGAILTPQTGVFAVGYARTLSNYLLTGLYASAGIEF